MLKKKEIFKNWTLPRNCRYWLIEHLMLHLFTLKSNSSFVNAQHNHKTVWQVWQIHVYRQYFKILNFQRKILNIAWSLRNASESPIFIFLPRFWRILNFRDISCLKFFFLVYISKNCHVWVGRIFSFWKIHCRYLNMESRNLLEIHVQTT